MTDQAERLRQLIRTREQRSPKKTGAKILTVTSGKGGVGKSNFTLNFALTLQARGYRVLIFDADIGLANLDVLMGISPKYTLYHLVRKEKTIWEIIHKGHNGLQFIAGGSGFTDLIRLTEEQVHEFTDQVAQLADQVDYILFDTGAGLSKETLNFILAAEETIVITTPEPTSITDAYAIIKMVNSIKPGVAFRLVVNRVTNRHEGRETSERISAVAKRFLDMTIPTLGFVSDDSNITRAVKRQVPFVIAYPNTAASKDIAEITDRFLAGQQWSNDPYPANSIKTFLHRLFQFTK